jgi:transcriptional regulator with XRE-family HTH domain
MNHMTAQGITAEIRVAIARRNFSYTKVAAELGLTVSQFSRRINGKVEFSATELAKLSGILDVPVGAFFGEVAA